MTHSAAGAPYFPGQSLDLHVLTESSGVSTSSTLRIRVDIRSLCVPFTKSQVMRIAIPPETGSGLPLKAILKLYDRRCIDDRDEDLWSPTSEAAVLSAWREKRWGEFPLNPLDEPEEEEEELPGYTDNDGIFHYTGPTTDNRDEAEKEEEYRKYCMVSSTVSRVSFTFHNKNIYIILFLLSLGSAMSERHTVVCLIFKESSSLSVMLPSKSFLRPRIAKSPRPIYMELSWRM